MPQSLQQEERPTVRVQPETISLGFGVTSESLYEDPAWGHHCPLSGNKKRRLWVLGIQRMSLKERKSVRRKTFTSQTAFEWSV